MDEACVITSLFAGALDGPVIFAGAFNGHDQIAQIVLSVSLAHLIEECLEMPARMRNGLRRNQDRAVEIGEHELRPRFGAVEAEHAEVLRPDPLYPLADLPIGFLDEILASRPARRSTSSHSTASKEREFPVRQCGTKKCFFLRPNPHTRGSIRRCVPSRCNPVG